MRIKYEVDKDKMRKFLDYFYTSNEPFAYEYCVVVFGYIIDNNLLNYSFDILGGLCRGKVRYRSPIAREVRDLVKHYFEKPLNTLLADKSIRWLKIGIDFMLTNCKEYIPIGILKSETLYKEEKKAIKEYIIENKEEFPDVYLDLLL